MTYWNITNITETNITDINKVKTVLLAVNDDCIEGRKSGSQENDTIKKVSGNPNHNFIQGTLKNDANQLATKNYNNVSNTNSYS